MEKKLQTVTLNVTVGDPRFNVWHSQVLPETEFILKICDKQCDDKTNEEKDVNQVHLDDFRVKGF
jgi:hypothetical protein